MRRNFCTANGRPKKRRQTGEKPYTIAKSRDNSIFNGPGDTIPLDGFNEIQMDVDTILPPEFPLSSGSRRSSQVSLSNNNKYNLVLIEYMYRI